MNKWMLWHLALIPMSLGIGGCDKERAAAASRKGSTNAACRELVQRSLVSPESYKRVGIMAYKEEGEHGRAGQRYTATNAFGAKLESTWLCSYNHRLRQVEYLEIKGPLGDRVIVSGLPPQLAAPSPAAPSRDGQSFVTWRVARPLKACPEISDLDAYRVAVSEGRAATLPSQCRLFQAGDKVLGSAHGPETTARWKGKDFGLIGDELEGRFYWAEGADRSALTSMP